ncbi:PAS domain-containing protein [Occallatibacter savannae]|uniref:PAS domain-containing protein n=1 Tax=Occallatibacter savannae TaxID=1002691 RepID=UPI0013A555C8|nr:PAS domain-containing protein [Occallatibacter savannae]
MESKFAAPDGLWIIDAKGKTVYVNEDMADMLGTTSSDLLGTDSFMFVYPEDIDAAKLLFAAKAAGSRAPFHFKLRRVDGHPIWADVQATPMRNAAGQFIGIVGSFTVSELQTK